MDSSHVEEFADNNNGEFPLNIFTDKDLRGFTALDTYGGGFENIFTWLPTNPVDGTASTPGDVGFQPVVENDVITYYTITR